MANDPPLFVLEKEKGLRLIAFVLVSELLWIWAAVRSTLDFFVVWPAEFACEQYCV